MDIESATMLLKVKAEKSMLRTLCGLTHEETEINLHSQGLGPADAMLLAPEVSVMTSLTKISLASNPLKEEGTKVICDALKSNSTLKELDLNGSGYTSGIIGGSAGAKHVADMLGVNTSLTRCNILSNKMDVASAKLLVDAVKDKDCSLAGITPDQTTADFNSDGPR